MSRPWPLLYADIEGEPYAPFPRPVPIPATNFDAGQQFQLVMNGEWLARVLGALETLLQPDAWDGTFTEQLAAVDQVLAMLAASPATGGGGVKIGTIFNYATANPPAGAVACDGTVYADTDYPLFWADINPAWKVDATHWAIDARNLFPVGAGGTYDPADTGGAEAVTLTRLQIPNTSIWADSALPGSEWGTARWLAASGSIAVKGYNAAAGQSHENRPPFLAMPFAVQVEDA